MKTIPEISAMQYMRAHGNAPGPTHRPYLTGVVSGALAAVPNLLFQNWTGALTAVTESISVGLWKAVVVNVLILVIAGVIYAAIFRRAANDTGGGWLFGISYGFLTWVVGPVAIWQWTTGEPLAIGTAAMGLFGAHLVYGLVLGGLYPYINRLLQSKSW
jgi:hypothetical protein